MAKQGQPAAIAHLAEMAAANNSAAPGAAISQLMTAAMFAAVQDGCDCETCQLMAKAARAMRAAAAGA